MPEKNRTEHQRLYADFRPVAADAPVLTQKINLRMDVDMHARLMKAARRNRTHHAELVRTFIEWGLSQCD